MVRKLSALKDVYHYKFMKVSLIKSIPGINIIKVSDHRTNIHYYTFDNDGSSNKSN